MIVPDDITNEPSSPACALHEVNDAYLGYASEAELKIALAEILRDQTKAATMLVDFIPRVKDPATRASLNDFLQSGLARIDIIHSLMNTPRPE